MATDPAPEPVARRGRWIALYGIPGVLAVVAALAWPPLGGALSVAAAVVAAVAAVTAAVGSTRP
jgi:hypothetical protein